MGSEFLTPTVGPIPPTREEAIGFEASQDRSIAPFFKDAEGGQSPFDRSLDERFLGGGGAGLSQPAQQPSQPMPAPSPDDAASGQPAMEQQQHPAPAAQAPISQRYGPPKFHRDAKGKWSITVEAGDNKVTERQEWIDGQSVIVRTVTRPDGTIAEERSVARGIPPEAEQSISRSAEEYGPPGSPAHGQAALLLRKARDIPDPMTRQAFLSAIPDMIRQGGRGVAAPTPAPPSGAAPTGRGGAGPVTDITSAQREAEAAKVRQIAAETTARERAAALARPLEGAPAEKVEALLALDRTAGSVEAITTNPSFVNFIGKGSLFSNAAARYVSDLDKAGAAIKQDLAAGKKDTYDGSMFGAASGWWRQLRGLASPGEIELRQKVGQLSNQVLYMYSGKQINEAEYERIKATLVNLWDEPQTFVVKLATIRADIANMRADVYKVKGTSVEEGMRESEAQRRSVPRATAPRPAAPTPRGAPGGPNAVLPDATREAERQRFWREEYDRQRSRGPVTPAEVGPTRPVR